MSNGSGMTKEEKNWGMLTHLAAFAFFLLPFAGHIIGPLVVYLLKKDDYPFVEDQGKEALNFQISITIYWVISGVFVIVMIGFLFLSILAILWFVLILVASVNASNGQRYCYPFTIRFIN